MEQENWLHYMHSRITENATDANQESLIELWGFIIVRNVYDEESEYLILFMD